MLLRPKSITAMLLMPMIVFGIISADTRFRRARQIPSRSREAMQSCVITWPAWLENLAVSLVVPMHSIVRSVCSSIASTADNSTSIGSLLTQPTSWSSLAHQISHSLSTLDIIEHLCYFILVTEGIHLGRVYPAVPSAGRCAPPHISLTSLHLSLPRTVLPGPPCPHATHHQCHQRDLRFSGSIV